MKRALSILALCLALPAQGQPATAPAADAAEPQAAEPQAAEVQGLRILSAEGLDLAQFLWTDRIVAVLADTPNDPAFIQQMRLLAAAAGRLIERDVVVITDTAPRGGSELRTRLRPRGFMLAIVEKDGTIPQRRPAPRDVREISAMIDRFPLRRQEMLERMPATR